VTRIRWSILSHPPHADAALLVAGIAICAVAIFLL
jgi:hypothetical protein